MLISGFDKLSLVNYPGLVACTIFTNGCNYRCPFCQNGGLVVKSDDTRIDEVDIFNYLKKRKGIIDGICISGGEPTIQKDLESFIKKVKKTGCKVKLDTNGSNPKVLKKLLDQNLLDYVAMDIKNSFDKYPLTTGSKPKLEDVKESIKILKNANIDYEFRTTLVKEFHNAHDVVTIAKMIGNSPYYLQNFVDSEGVIEKGLHGLSFEELKALYESVKKDFPNIKVRGTDVESERS